MAKNVAFVLFPIIFAAVTSFNLQTTVFDGTASTISELVEPFKKVGDHHYLIEATIKTTWLGAVNFCRTEGAHLVSFETEKEWQTLSSYLVSENYTDSQWFWIAGNDIDEPFKFFWISTGQPMLFTKWSSGQPDNLGGNERCTHLWRIGNEFLMNDWMCNQKAHYICKANDPKTISITVW